MTCTSYFSYELVNGFG